MDLTPIYFAAGILAGLSTYLLVRILYVIYTVLTSECSLEVKKSSLRTIICIGSGGHTSEMLRILNFLPPKKFLPRCYVMADSDVSSEVKIHKHEQRLNNKEYSIIRIPRSRHVKQSYISSVASTLYAIFATIPVVFNATPDVILCNGPGTCIPVCVIAFLLRCLFIIDTRIVFIESVCRVRTMSLTGKILLYFADVIVVQWIELKKVCSRAKYFGRLT